MTYFFKLQCYHCVLERILPYGGCSDRGQADKARNIANNSLFIYRSAKRHCGIFIFDKIQYLSIHIYFISI